MTFDELLVQVRELLQNKGRVSYRALKLQFNLDEEHLEGLKDELIEAERVATDEDGKVLVWIGHNRPESRVQSPESEGQRRTSSVQTLDPRRQILAAVAERRQLTVMFCDLVGSTALSHHLDPEDLREVIQAYRETCATVIRRFEGHLAKYIGDGLLVYFGYPQAHEDDAARAVRVGLEIVAAIQTLVPSPFQKDLHFSPSPVPTGEDRGEGRLQVRIGIHTGLVVAGEMGTVDQPEHLAIVGETPNIAARLQEKALPNSVVISPTTYRLVSGLFACEELGSQELKGISTPLVVYRVVGESVAQNRFEVAVQKGLTPLVGRSEELALLQQRWAQAKAGAGQVMLLSGEPGIGKSRLLQELKEHLAHEEVTRIELRCSPYHQNSALYPIIDHLQRLLQFAREDTPAVKLAKLQHTLSHYRFPQADTVPLVAALLSLPHPKGYPLMTVSPQKQKEKTHAALVTWLVEEAERQPIYNTWEDLHWADPSTLEVLTLIVDHAPTSSLYVLLTFRPEFTPPWGPHSYLSQLTLSRLGQSQVETMVERMMGGAALPAEVIQQIVTKTDGVPLFVEELTKSVVEAERTIGVTSGSPRQTLIIPTTLQDALMARLDRLGAAKEIAQLGATIGREFPYQVLRSVSLLNENTLHQGLRQLVETELVYQSGVPPQARYLFKHALIQDTAYQSLLKSKRQQLHQQIAQVLADQFPETKEHQPELLAHHYTEAGLSAQAIPYWQQAGQRAVQRSANREAERHLTTALKLLKMLPDASKRTEQELVLQATLGTVLRAIKGLAAPEARQAYARAWELCQQMGETPHLFPLLFSLRSFSGLLGNHQTCLAQGRHLVTLAQKSQDAAQLVAAHYSLGWPLSLMGDFVQGYKAFKQGVALYDPEQHSSLAYTYGSDPGATCLIWMAQNLWFLGYPDQALRKIEEALALAERFSHPFSVCFVVIFAGYIHRLRRQWRSTQEHAEVVITTATEHEFPHWLQFGQILRGRALAQQGQAKEGIAEICRGLDGQRATKVGGGLTQHLTDLAEAYKKAGHPEEGLNALAEALALVDRTEERWFEAELYRLRGELMLAQSRVQSLESKVKEAEECFHKAIEIARKQQAKSLELRAATSLARLWQQQGKQKEAHFMLSEIYNWFTEGFDTKDLQEAKALLDGLESNV